MEASQALFQPDHLPAELFEGVDVKSLAGSLEVNALDIIGSWLRERVPLLNQKQECVDMISGKSTSSLAGDAAAELSKCAKLATMAYALPYFMNTLSTVFHLKNPNFMTYMSRYLADSTFLAYQHMDRLLRDMEPTLPLPNDAQFAGYYIRTAIRITNAKGTKLLKIPSWDKRTQLLKCHIVGNVNVYVLRQNLSQGYECMVLFRGTSNEFNGLEQYGDAMKHTQVFRAPNFNPETNHIEEKGSETVPLMNKLYTEMIRDVMPHIIQCLEWLRWDHPRCQRITVTGHSMGGALVLHFCYLLHQFSQAMWKKTFFRSFAAPLSCNEAMTRQIEQWLIDSQQVNKYIEVVNTDDFVNSQMSLGGKSGLSASIKRGTSSIGAFLVDAYLTKSRNFGGATALVDYAKRNHDVTMAAFLNGAFQAQIEAVPTDRRAAFRLGQRPPEIKAWKTPALDHVYSGTVRLVYCNRFIDWNSEYPGKGHSQYLDMNMSLFWGSLRLYEDERYRYYAQNTLRANNNLQIIPMFPMTDMTAAVAQLAEYSPMHNPRRVVRQERSPRAR